MINHSKCFYRSQLVREKAESVNIGLRFSLHPFSVDASSKGSGPGAIKLFPPLFMNKFNIPVYSYGQEETIS